MYLYDLSICLINLHIIATIDTHIKCHIPASIGVTNGANTLNISFSTHSSAYSNILAVPINNSNKKNDIKYIVIINILILVFFSLFQLLIIDI